MNIQILQSKGQCKRENGWARRGSQMGYVETGEWRFSFSKEQTQATHQPREERPTQTGKLQPTWLRICANVWEGSKRSIPTCGEQKRLDEFEREDQNHHPQNGSVIVSWAHTTTERSSARLGQLFSPGEFSGQTGHCGQLGAKSAAVLHLEGLEETRTQAKESNASRG